MIEAMTVTSLFIWGLHSVTRDGMILGFVERFWQWENPAYAIWRNERDAITGLESGPNGYLELKGDESRRVYKEWLERSRALGESPPKTYTPKIAYPLSECPVCMAGSLWGSLAWWLRFAPDYSADSFADWPVFCIATAGLCALLGYFNV